LHRWRYANVGNEESELTLVDDKNRLAACGDWCSEGRVEAAYLSARRIVSKLTAAGVG
jgi:predicted NAD/FAD-dependent oxidoreductase